MTAPVLSCKWCGKKLGARFERRCKDCGHSMYMHRIHRTSDAKTCVVGTCTCSALQPVSRMERTSEQFPRQRVGYGLDTRGKFCSLTCASNWAHAALTRDEMKGVR